MDESTLWWVIAGFFVSLELLAGSTYLIMLALGAVAAAVSAHAGAPETVQMVLATFVGGGLVLNCHRKLLKRGVLVLEDYNTTGLGEPDLGEEVCVKGWAPDGTAEVEYRGGSWLARHHGPLLPRSGAHRILAIEPTCLVLEPTL
jgi:membrane protein implicated in regulation of membrane protease activity